MNIKWTNKALADLARLYEFLMPINKIAAARFVKSLTLASKNLLEHPRIGEKLEGFDPHEIRRIFIGQYELRYEISNVDIYVLRIWHTRENR